MLYKFPKLFTFCKKEYEPPLYCKLFDRSRALFQQLLRQQYYCKEDKNSSYKVALTFAFSFVMKQGLQLLGIKVPEKM